LHEHKPNPGDFMVCLYCAQMMRFTDELTPRVLTAEEEHELPDEARQYWHAVQMSVRSRQ
jgi:hypothetical protein